ncbi:MAG: PssE/Cps14G family polysaccharide biosynthesis glycosyltransferase [Bacilli bacterium]
MILILLGTQDKPFNRILESVEEGIIKGYIKDKVVAQIGCTKFESNHMTIFDFISSDLFEQYINDADIIITHGGVGSIVTSLKKGKKVIAVARLSKYGEHVNDHQIEIVEKYAKENLILAYNENDNLEDILNKISTFNVKKYENDSTKIIDFIRTYININ